MIFKNTKDLVQQVNTALGQFCNEFGNKRKELAQMGRAPKRGILFTYDDDKSNNWAINEGGGTEIQYHIVFDSKTLEIRYGLGFNTQYVPFANDMTTVEYMQPFMLGFLKNETQIKALLPDYDFVYGDINQLKKPRDNQYTLFGKKVSVKKNVNDYTIADSEFDSIIADLKRQFEPYKIIFREKKNFRASVMKIQNTMNVLSQKKQIILQGPPGTGKTREAKDIAEQLIFGNVTDDKKEQKANLESSEQFKLVQFHPSYSYEDFVRGIVVKTDVSTTPEYKTVNKILGDFAKKANQSNLSGGVDDFDRAWHELIQDINDGSVTKIGSSGVPVSINSQENIKFNSPVATYEKTYELYKFGETDLIYETYQKIVLKYLKDPNGKYKLQDYDAPKEISSNKPYVLIIDEINRANLPAVLGELIYALEYRGEKVESMYATPEDGNTLLIPENLLIIGTMNTSDRSVGHIDYAIRRRFAFIDILPKVLNIPNFELELFKKVTGLFIQNFDEYQKDNKVLLTRSEHLSEEFRPEDVWLGHSYFINTGEDFLMRKNYEIIPILKEYINDGILKQSATAEVNSF
ncbi:McrB family protein [Croceibacter atlanticus]|uniref:McrB family protein n=1 Tax=Croceibacter atlanticus TaxID=313588 RepID=UPI0024BB50B4|nr:AAA family ATPase [Croceibacter atlanticus]